MAHHYSRGLGTPADRIQRIDRMLTLNIANSCDYSSTQRRMPRAGGRTPRTPRSGGGPHASSGASCCVGQPFWAHQMQKKICWSPGLRPGPRWGSLQRSPRPSSWWRGAPREPCCPLAKNPTYNIVIVLVLCVCTHMYDKKLSCCCDSRSYCVQYFNAIHCEHNISTSE